MLFLVAVSSPLVPEPEPGPEPGIDPDTGPDPSLDSDRAPRLPGDLSCLQSRTILLSLLH